MDEVVSKLRSKHVYIGTSSWKYAGWKDLVYAKPYKSEKDFNERCLAEIADHYSTVGIDHTYYAWPLPSTFEKYAALTPSGFLMGLKVTERVTAFQFPKLPRYGKVAGTRNQDFLNADVFENQFIKPLLPYQDRIGVLMFEFSQFYPGMLESGAEFVDRLSQFLKTIVARYPFQLSVEIRNRTWLKPEYFEMLLKYHVAHVFNSWTRMPTLSEQLTLTDTYAFPAIVSRILLQPGTKYEQAVEAFSPYDKIQEESMELRRTGADLIRRALKAGVPAFVFVNNRAEGCAPKTIQGILDLIRAELK